MQTADSRLIQYSLAIVWIVTGVLSLGIYPKEDSFALLGRIGIEGIAASAALYLGSTADIVFGLMALFATSNRLWIAQALLVLIYTVVISIYLPEFWLQLRMTDMATVVVTDNFTLPVHYWRYDQY